MRTVVRYLNVAIAGLCLASALIVLGTNVFDPVYRAKADDALWFVALYATAQAAVLGAMWRDTPAVPWIGIAKALLAYAFLVTFVPLGPWWMAWSPGRYVYTLFDWGPGAEFILFGFLFIGRGAGNTMNALLLTEPWWRPWRRTQPLLSRVFTAVPVGIVVLCVWTFFEVVRTQWTRDVAQMVLDGLDCPTVQAKQGETTTDVRQMGTQKFVVRITYGCPATRVMVADQTSHIGMVEGASRCCVTGS